MAKLELTAEMLKEAKGILADDPPDPDGHEDVLLFVEKGGDVLRIDEEGKLQPGMVGHVSVAPKVYAITLEQEGSEEQLADLQRSLQQAKDKLAASKKLPKSQRPDEDELQEMEEEVEQWEETVESMSEYSIGLSFTLDWSQLKQEEEDMGLIPVGAFVFAPTKDGAGNVDKPVVLHSSEELEEFMARWALRSP